MTDALASSISGAIAGGVCSGLFVLLAPYIDKRRSARYLAVRVSLCLDEYVSSCASTMVAPDAHEIPPDDDPMDHFETPTPLNFPEDVDWRSVDSQLAYNVLSLANETMHARDVVVYIWGVAGGDAAFETMRDSFSDIGLRAHDLAQRLRKEFSLKQRDRNPAASDEYDPVSKLQEIRKLTRGSQT